jgi:hypothetical protein
MAFTPTLLNSASGTSTSTTITSASISPAANALLIVSSVALRPTGGTMLQPTISDTLSGGSLTWTRRVSVENTVTGTMVAVIFTAITGASPGSGTVTVTYPSSAARLGLHVIEVPDGYHATTPVLQTASNTGTGSTITATFGGTPTSTSMVIGTVGARDTDGDIAAGSGFTEIHELTIGALGGNNVNQQSQYDVDNADTTCDWTGIGTGANVVAVAIEIAAAAAGGVPKHFMFYQRMKEAV